MTLPSSGTITYADFVAELRTSGNLVFPDTATRWLADVPTGPVVIPTDFHSKSAVKLVDEIALGAGSSFTLNGVNFGPDFSHSGGSDRGILAIVGSYNSGLSDMNVSSFTIGGVVPAVIADAWASDAAGSVALACGSVDIAATSGTIAITMTNAITAGRVYVFAYASTGSFNADGGVSVSDTGLSVSTVDVAQNGIFFGAAVKANTNDLTLTGVTGRHATNISGGRIEIGWDTKLAVQSNKLFSFTGSGAAACAMRAFAFNS